MSEISIELYKPEYKKDFIRLNLEWINTYFRLETTDIMILGNIENCINEGGQIFVALSDSVVVGCCALIRHTETSVFEFSKLAVTPNFQGKGIGRRLGERAIAYAKSKSIKQLFFEGNSTMKASIVLCEKLGFRDVIISNSVYNRCNVMMMLDI